MEIEKERWRINTTHMQSGLTLFSLMKIMGKPQKQQQLQKRSVESVTSNMFS